MVVIFNPQSVPELHSAATSVSLSSSN